MKKKIKRIQGKGTNIEDRQRSDIQKIGVLEEKKQSKERGTFSTFATCAERAHNVPETVNLEQPTSEKF